MKFDFSSDAGASKNSLVSNENAWTILGPRSSVNPAISVVMPVHNALPYLDEAIQSILDQSFAEFELIIGDDCSTDGSLERIREFAKRDGRIRFAHSNRRLGPVGSSNWVANAARAPFVARMDADDISHRDRLECQMAALNANPNAVMVGSLFDIIDGRSKVVRRIDRSSIGWGTHLPVAHPSIFYRKAAFDKVGGYRIGSDYTEDHDLFQRLESEGDLLIIADNLVLYRYSGSSIRLNDAPEKVEDLLNKAALRIYGSDLPPSHRLEPTVVRTVGSLRLWSGQSMGILLPMLWRMRIFPLKKGLGTVVWALLCIIAPSLVRELVRWRVKWRNWRARDRFKAGHIYLWRHDHIPVDLGSVGKLGAKK